MSAFAGDAFGNASASWLVNKFSTPKSPQIDPRDKYLSASVYDHTTMSDVPLLGGLDGNVTPAQQAQLEQEALGGWDFNFEDLDYSTYDLGGLNASMAEMDGVLASMQSRFDLDNTIADAVGYATSVDATAGLYGPYADGYRFGASSSQASWFGQFSDSFIGTVGSGWDGFSSGQADLYKRTSGWGNMMWPITSTIEGFGSFVGNTVGLLTAMGPNGLKPNVANYWESKWNSITTLGGLIGDTVSGDPVAAGKLAPAVVSMGAGVSLTRRLDGPSDSLLASNSIGDAIRYESHWDDLGKVPASLTNRETRAWYLSKEMDIPSQLDTSKSLEYQAKQSFEIRNDLRSTARNLMADQRAANYLRVNEPNLTWGELVAIKSMKYSGNDLWNSIINSSQKSRESVNVQFNFVGDRPRYD